MTTHSIGSHIDNTTPENQHQIKVLNLDVPYMADPTDAYFTLCGDSPCHLLLESAEVDPKKAYY